MNKVTLPKEVAEALEKLREGFHDHGVVVAVFDGAPYTFNPYYFGVEKTREYFHDKPAELMSALVNGYEVEQTPEEKVQEYYDFLRSASTWNEDHAGKVRAIEKTLDLLGIKISGVNAE
jgi:hypothetical protein